MQQFKSGLTAYRRFNAENEDMGLIFHNVFS
jgi:hypothetical protein